MIVSGIFVASVVGGVLAVSNPAIPNIHSVPGSDASFYEKLNTRWHERALQGFMLVVLAHWAASLLQLGGVHPDGNRHVLPHVSARE